MYKIIKKNDKSFLPSGFYMDGVYAGLKAKDKLDLAFIYSQKECDIASLFTTNKMIAAPILHFKNKGRFKTNFVLINSKNANAMTGKNGVQDINEILEALPFNNLINPIMSSTGVIGVPLPKQKIIKATKEFNLANKEPKNASKAIMTTDTCSKRVCYKVVLNNKTSFSVWGMAKGAGMIDPAMATMLCFITTDADVEQNEMQEILDELTDVTFNAISVDGDTSTNDTILLLSNKLSGAYQKDAFKDVIYKVMRHLALEILKDAEGATKLVTYHITGAKNSAEAKKVAKKLSNSLLIKTALFGEDPNWGRIASTVGASDVTCKEEFLSISFNDVCVYSKGKSYFDTKNEKKASKVMKLNEFTIHCDLGIADGEFTGYGCDLGHEYIKINADYRT